MIDELFAVVCDDDDQGVCGIVQSGVMIPCVTGIYALAEAMYQAMVEVSYGEGRTLRIARFRRAEDVTPANGTPLVQ